MPINQPNNQYPQQDQYQIPMQQTSRQYGAWMPYQGIPSGGPVLGGSGPAGNPDGKGKNASNKPGGKKSKKGKKHGNNGKGGSNGRIKGKRPVSFYVAIAIAAVAVVAAGIFAWMTFADQPQRASRGGIIGQVEGKSKEEIQAELDRKIEEGMFNISIASVAEFEDGASEGELKIENVPNNPYLMQVVITRNDTGEVIYTSDILEPNYHIQFDKLDVDLEAGTYECTATFHALDKETEEEVGTAAAIMTIIVKS